MTLNKNTPFFESKVNLGLAIGLISLLIAIFFGVYGIYSAYQEDKTDISFEIINEANVFDVREPMDNLTISYEGEDIQEKNLNIRIITFRVTNVGNVNILQNYYDANDIWGAQVNEGKIIRIKLIDSNSNYIKSNLKPRLYDIKTIEFTKTIFEKGDYFTLEIFVLHNKDKSPSIITRGKIAGIDEIKLVDNSVEKEETFINKLFYGGFIINLIRLILSIFSIFAILGTHVGVMNLLNAYRRRICKKTVVDTLLKELHENNVIKSMKSNELKILYHNWASFRDFVCFLENAYIYENVRKDAPGTRCISSQMNHDWQTVIDIDNLIQHIEILHHLGEIRDKYNRCSERYSSYYLW